MWHLKERKKIKLKIFLKQPLVMVERKLLLLFGWDKFKVYWFPCAFSVEESQIVLPKSFPFKSWQRLSKSTKLSKSWRYIFSGLQVENKVLDNSSLGKQKFLLLQLAEYHKRVYLTINQTMSSSNTQEEYLHCATSSQVGFGVFCLVFGRWGFFEIVWLGFGGGGWAGFGFFFEKSGFLFIATWLVQGEPASDN